MLDLFICKKKSMKGNCTFINAASTENIRNIFVLIKNTNNIEIVNDDKTDLHSHQFVN